MAYNPAFTPVTSSQLYAANEIIGNDCKNENRAFLLCKSLDRNPETCLNTGEKVSACVMSTYVFLFSYTFLCFFTIVLNNKYI